MACSMTMRAPIVVISGASSCPLRMKRKQQNSTSSPPTTAVAMPTSTITMTGAWNRYRGARPTYAAAMMVDP
jgi:hypothetical protein